MAHSKCPRHCCRPFSAFPAFLWPIFKYVVPVITGYSGYLPTHDAYTWPCYDYVYRTKPDERAKYKGDDCTESKCDAFCWFEQSAG